METPEFAQLYFHHSWDDLRDFHYQVLYRPSRVAGLVGMKRNPFPWLRIIKKES
jgi:hypothetical protein